MAIDYKSAGVDIRAGEETVDRIKPLIKRTLTKNVLSDIGLFGGFYDAKFPEFEHPVLVASTDGVGTKLKIAVLADKHNTVGHCLVNHCTNDILTSGARPLFFLDYFATGKLNPQVAASVIEGFTDGCVENGCSLIGGETAEMPSMYAEGEYDVSGTIVGIVEKNKIVDGKKIDKGDVLIGLPSNGLHTNGYSLARKVLLTQYSVTEFVPELGMTLADELLKIHRSYLKDITPLLDANILLGISHITGGGIIGNTKRILQPGLSLEINWDSWEVPPIFKLIQKIGEITDAEMREVFNMGIGLILVVRPENTATALNLLAPSNPMIIGNIG
ncbi:MAG: phosphoribosylformylglycinamidine cyclo-ligase [Ignavibacteria bacterium GWF2_33_9]|nr:MAG: phosphoribosylformylglycinamidine cyclo-ligase [Ignavibacteria bacterium GWF2_33_9]